jgi:hypothetical protein
MAIQAVKDTGGSVSIVTADEWTINAHGLMCLENERKVTWYGRWAAFWETTTALCLSEAQVERKT